MKINTDEMKADMAALETKLLNFCKEYECGLELETTSLRTTSCKQPEIVGLILNAVFSR